MYEGNKQRVFDELSCGLEDNAATLGKQRWLLWWRRWLWRTGGVVSSASHLEAA